MRPITRILLCVSCLTVMPSGIHASSDRGGSGLSQVDSAWSMNIQDLLFGVHARYVSDGAGADSIRYIEFTPTLTKGLGGGFEASAALPFEGVTSSLDDAGRRFDVRRADLTGKLRWTTNLGTPRARFGIQGLAAVPLDGFRDIRSGGTEKPDNAFDPGVQALFSTNIGAFDFPMRFHLNGGYWFSRNDGSVYFRDHRSALDLGSTIDDNDVVSGAAGVEIGFRRFVGFAELTTEHLIGGRAEMRGKESLWRLTPGIQTGLTSTIGLMAAVSFDLSGDDPRTAFRPQDTYSDVEFRIGLDLGNVLSRNKYESRKRLNTAGWDLVDTSPAEATVDSLVTPAEPAAPAVDLAVAEPVAEPVAVTEPVAVAIAEPVAAPVVEPVSTPVPAEVATPEPPVAALEQKPTPPAIETTAVPAAPVTPSAAPMATRPEVDVLNEIEKLRRDYEARIRDVETNTRFSFLENRVSQVERTSAYPFTSMAYFSPQGGLREMASPDDPRLAELNRLTRQLNDRLAALENAQLAAGTPAATAERRAVTPTPTARETTASPVVPDPVVSELLSRLQALERTRVSQDRTRADAFERELASVRRELDRMRSLSLESSLTRNGSEDSDAAIREVARTLNEFLEAPVPSPTATRATTQVPLAVGERQWFLAPDDAELIRKVVAAWSSILASSEDVRIAVVVHGGEAARRDQALRETQDLAGSIRDAFVSRGVGTSQLVAMGMGRAELDAEGPNPRVEIERLR